MPMTWAPGDQIEWFDPTKHRGLKRRGQGQKALIKDVHKYDRYSGMQKLTIGLQSSTGAIVSEIVVDDSEVLFLKSAEEILNEYTPTVNLQKLHSVSLSPKLITLDNSVNMYGALMAHAIPDFRAAAKGDMVKFQWACRYGAQIFASGETCYIEDNVTTGQYSYLTIQAPRNDRVEIMYEPIYQESLLP